MELSGDSTHLKGVWKGNYSRNLSSKDTYCNLKLILSCLASNKLKNKIYIKLTMDIETILPLSYKDTCN